MSSAKDLFSFPFSHIYVEEKVMDNELTRKILSRYAKSSVIPIAHYKDVFNRPNQSFLLQKAVPSLILARNTGASVFQGAPVCQDFGYDHFYYTSCARNCIFDCEYCYLRGMYGSGNVVIFVNLEDIFSEVEELLKSHPVYLCVSFDTDLIALENLTGFVSRWAEFTRSHEDLTIEIRTKSFRKDIYGKIAPCDRVIFAYTLSPQEIIEKYEKRTASLADRLGAAACAMEKGFPVRLCFDPLIYVQSGKDLYTSMFEEVQRNIDVHRLKDVSVGSFRISSEYIKKIRKDFPTSSICQFPYENHEGYMEYPERIRSEMENHLMALLQTWIPREKIFTTDPSEDRRKGEYK